MKLRSVYHEAYSSCSSQSSCEQEERTWYALYASFVGRREKETRKESNPNKNDMLEEMMKQKWFHFLSIVQYGWVRAVLFFSCETNEYNFSSSPQRRTIDEMIRHVYKSHHSITVSRNVDKIYWFSFQWLFQSIVFMLFFPIFRDDHNVEIKIKSGHIHLLCSFPTSTIESYTFCLLLSIKSLREMRSIHSNINISHFFSLFASHFLVLYIFLPHLYGLLLSLFWVINKSNSNEKIWSAIFYSKINTDWARFSPDYFCKFHLIIE